MIYFIGAGPGDYELITIKAQRILKEADFVLYTGSLVPKEVLSWCKKDAIVLDSQHMQYDEIFAHLRQNKDKLVARVHTGDPTLYSTIAKQIAFLKQEGIEYEVIAGVSALFGASASLGIEYTIPGVSQTLIITRLDGNTPSVEKLENILNCKHSSIVFYLSITLIDKLVSKAKEMGYGDNTPCWVVEKATWSEEMIYKGTIDDIAQKVNHIKGVALILFGEFLNQQEMVESHLYGSKWV